MAALAHAVDERGSPDALLLLAEIRALPEDTVYRCEECQRILVRTSESGL